MNERESTQNERTMATLRTLAKLGTVRVSVTSSAGVNAHYDRLLREGLVRRAYKIKGDLMYACYTLTATGYVRLHGDAKKGS